MEDYQHILVFTAGFAIIALASKQIGQFFSQMKLPLISGFLFAGIISGPFVLGFISAEAVEKLRFVDEISLAVIAFAAGSELYLKELRSRFKSITWVAIGNIVVIPVFGTLTVFLLADFVPFMRDMSMTNRIAVSMVAGGILVARSPSSAIAIINELRAKGPFTRTILGVTMITDVAVIFLFAFNTSVADAILTNLGFDLGFVTLLLAELAMSLTVGYVLGKIIHLILLFRINKLVKKGMLLGIGYGAFVLPEALREFSHTQLSFEIFLEPLLICMIGSFVVTNYCRCRAEFLQILHDIGPPIYIAFFTLTGASLALDVLVTVWPIAIALFAVRAGAIFVGSFTGGVLAGDPAKHNQISWMAYITQAGVGLGLAKEVSVEFPEWGTAFSTMIIAVIVLNQIVGPPFFKWAINWVGESNLRAKAPEFDGVRDAIIFGLEGQSLALAHQLKIHNWQVKIACRTAKYMEHVNGSDIEICPISDLNPEMLRQLGADKADAVVTLLSDEENYLICEYIYEHFGTKDVVVRLNDRANFHYFHGLGALVVNPVTAIVSLFDHLVRSPSAASLLLGMEEDQDIIDVEVCNPNLHGLALRDLRLPLDTLILSVHRDGRLLISHGYTRLKIGDRVTLVGSLKSLDKLMLRFGG